MGIVARHFTILIFYSASLLVEGKKLIKVELSDNSCSLQSNSTEKLYLKCIYLKTNYSVQNGGKLF